MYRLALCLCLLANKISCAEMLVSYRDKQSYKKNHLDFDYYSSTIITKDIDGGLSLVFSQPLGRMSGPMLLQGGSCVSRWSLSDDVVYAYSTYLSARVYPFSILFLSPYIEISAGGPTYLSKAELSDISFGSKVVYQNFVAAGVKVSGFICDFRVINYSKDLPAVFSKKSVTLPFIISLGCVY